MNDRPPSEPTVPSVFGPIPVFDFQRRRSSPNGRSRHARLRLLSLVVMLGLILVLMLEARDPRYYAWWSGAGTGVAPQPRSGESPVSTIVSVDDRGEEPSDTFFSPRPGEAGEPRPAGPLGIDPSLLESIRDDKPLRPSEWEAWLQLLHVLDQTDEATLRNASSGPVLFVQLLEQSTEYRGELVTVRGTLRRAMPTMPPRNELGLTGYHETWLWPADHPTDPMTVYCLELPQGFPTGMEIAEEVEITGFHFKVGIYQAADREIHRAPILLARSLEWRKKPKVAHTPRSMPVSPVWILLGPALLGVLVAAYVYYRTRRGKLSSPKNLPAVKTLEEAEVLPDVGTRLQQLAEEDSPP